MATTVILALICGLVAALGPGAAHRQPALPCSGAAPSWPQQFQQAAANGSGPLCTQLSNDIALQYVIAAAAVLFHVEARLPAETAYLGIGLSELGSMQGADMAIFLNTELSTGPQQLSSHPQASSVTAVTPSPNSPSLNTNTVAGWRLLDAFAQGFVAPVSDTHQDLRLLDLTYTSDNNTLRATWLRPLVPCDATQDLPLAIGQQLHILWAHGSSWGYHGRQRGSKLVKFGYSNNTSTTDAGSASNMDYADSSSGSTGSTGSTGSNTSGESATGGISSSDDTTSDSNNTSGSSTNSTANDTDVRVLDLVFPVTIPAQETTYRVQYFKLPDDRKYQIIKYEPVVNHPMLHHGVAYACTPSDEPKVEALQSLGPYDRLTQGMLCEQFLMTLASNMRPWQAPAVAGLPIGANATRYLALELHYNNPEALEGQQDPGSGIRIYYTPKLRRHDVGVLTLGQLALDIPPGMPAYATNVSVCPGSCTSRLQGPVQLLTGFFHMHGTGKDIIARHFRDGRELTPLGHLRAFDYAFQDNQEIYAPDAKVLLPGDSLTVQCTFDTTSRTNYTRSGPGTRDEMCFYWITYWPAQTDMGFCMSVGNSSSFPYAGCGSEFKTGDAFAATRPGGLAKALSRGVLVKFDGADPARNATPYVQQCTNVSCAT